ncbi:MAG TPA: type II secretion system protein [Abditibacterium sp.]|jgi:prepilin-type processing-associated H-X9-DG protein
MRHKAFTRIELVVVLLILGTIAAILFPVFARVRDNHKPSCQSTMKQIGLGFLQYQQDYGEQFPVTRNRVSGEGWVEILQPYLKSTALFQCPKESYRAGDSPTEPHFSDYWMNRRLSGQNRKNLSEITQTWAILAGDGNDGSDATTSSYALSQLPIAWRRDPQSPARRHLDYGNYLYLDGHVKALKPEKVTTQTARVGEATFAVR